MDNIYTDVGPDPEEHHVSNHEHTVYGPTEDVSRFESGRLSQYVDAHRNSIKYYQTLLADATTPAHLVKSLNEHIAKAENAIRRVLSRR